MGRARILERGSESFSRRSARAIKSNRNFSSGRKSCTRSSSRVEEAEDSVIFAGPNVSVRAGNWWVTATGLVELTNSPSEPNFQLRTIVGYTF